VVLDVIGVTGVVPVPLEVLLDVPVLGVLLDVLPPQEVIIKPISRNPKSL
jgi:hypothetical protein